MENTINTVINLDRFLSRKQRVLANRLMGEIAKEKTGINDLIYRHTAITIIVSEKILSVNPSWLQGFIQDIVMDIAQKKCATRVLFDCQGRYNIEDDLQETIQRILREARMI